jgi:L-aminopeptidase/D-esterase-like protein
VPLQITPKNSLSEIPGFLVGHAQDTSAITGCTVILCPQGTVAGVDQRGGAPGTRETDLLRPLHLVEQAHAVLLTGGSAYGLDAAGGVMRYLEERGIGFDTGVAQVPIVPSAVIFDLAIGRADTRPDASMGYQACQAASEQPNATGSVGAGIGATVGKIRGMPFAMKSGVGTACLELGDGVRVGALMVVNAFGDVVDPTNGEILAGVRAESPYQGNVFADTLNILQERFGEQVSHFAPGINTVIGVVASNVHLNKESANYVAQMAQDGIARTIRPAHTLVDGDTIFALASGGPSADPTSIGSFAAEAVALAIVQAVKHAQSAGGVPSRQELGL